MRMTKGERDRSYKVAMYALSAEIHAMKDVAPLSRKEIRERQAEIWQDCYGDMKPTKEKKHD